MHCMSTHSPNLCMHMEYIHEQASSAASSVSMESRLALRLTLGLLPTLVLLIALLRL